MRVTLGRRGGGGGGWGRPVTSLVHGWLLDLVHMNDPLDLTVLTPSNDVNSHHKWDSETTDFSIERIIDRSIVCTQKKQFKPDKLRNEISDYVKQEEVCYMVMANSYLFCISRLWAVRRRIWQVKLLGN